MNYLHEMAHTFLMRIADKGRKRISIDFFWKVYNTLIWTEVTREFFLLHRRDEFDETYSINKTGLRALDVF